MSKLKYAGLNSAILRREKMANKSGHTAISLFAGAGGLDIGFERTGFETVFANELDTDAAETWKTNRPDSNVMNQGDINDYIESLKDYEGTTVVFGGPPCQGFSVAGKMNPDDPRSKLIWSFLDVVETVHPKAFVIENVRALGTLKKWESVRNGIIKRANDLGYACDYKVYSASDFGVPQNRERVVFFGIQGDSSKLEQFFSEMEKKKSTPKALRDVLRSVGKYGSPENPQTCTAHITLAKRPVLRQSPYAGMLVNGAGRPMNLDGAAHTLPASMGGNKTPIVDENALETGEENWFSEYLRRLTAGEADPETEVVPDTLRRLTIKEAAALQTFPEDYVFCGRKTQQYKQIGNAVASDFAQAIAESTLACL